LVGSLIDEASLDKTGLVKAGVGVGKRRREVKREALTRFGLYRGERRRDDISDKLKIFSGHFIFLCCFLYNLNIGTNSPLSRGKVFFLAAMGRVPSHVL
jgi:hypothetical protein